MPTHRDLPLTESERRARRRTHAVRGAPSRSRGRTVGPGELLVLALFVALVVELSRYGWHVVIW